MAALENQKTCVYNGNSFNVEVSNADSYEDLKRKCLRAAVRESHQPANHSDANLYKLLLEPKADAVVGNTAFESIESLHLIETSKLSPRITSDAIDDHEQPDEYDVRFENDVKRIRVDSVDSLKTVLEKVRDIFGDSFHVDKVNAIYQDIDGQCTYIYNVDEPGNKSLKKTMEHARSRIVKDIPLIVTEREDSPEDDEAQEQQEGTEERERGQLHFSLGNDDYKRFPFTPTAKLEEILRTLGVEQPESVDLRVKARSVYNKAQANSKDRSLNVTVGECGLMKGDVIEIVESDKLLPSITCSLISEGKEEDPSNLESKSGLDVRQWKRRILEEFGRNVDSSDHILFESVERDGIEHYRALYNMEELSIVTNDDINLVLWMKCKYVEISGKKITEKQYEFEWPWGNKDYDHWTWGLVVSRREKSPQVPGQEHLHYFLRAVNDEERYINARTGDSVKNITRKSKIPGTDIDDKTPRDISMFIAFFNQKTKLIDGKCDPKILKYTRNSQLDVQLHNDRNDHLFWNPNRR